MPGGRSANVKSEKQYEALKDRAARWQGQPWRLSTAPWHGGSHHDAGPWPADLLRGRMKATVADHLLARPARQHRPLLAVMD